MIQFFVPGTPKTAGSKKAFVIPGKGGKKPRAVVTDDAGEAGKTWREDIRAAALAAMDDQRPLDGPLRVRAMFMMARPKGHYYSSKKNYGLLKPEAPDWHSSRPDVDKLVRALLDALTGIVYRDDGQVVQMVNVGKLYTNDYRPGARVEITPAGRWRCERCGVPYGVGGHGPGLCTDRRPGASTPVILSSGPTPTMKELKHDFDGTECARHGSEGDL